MLAAIFVLLAVGATSLVVALHRNSDLTSAQPPGPAQRVVMVVIGGIGQADINRESAPNISQLASSGTVYSRAWVGQAQVAPITSEATLGTGLLPAHHGVIGPQWARPRSTEVQAPSTQQQVQLGALDAVMQSNAGESLASRVKARYPNDAVASVSGDCPAADALGTWAADVVLCARAQQGQWLPGTVTGHSPSRDLLNPNGIAAQRITGGSLAAASQGWTPGTEDTWITNLALRVLTRAQPRLLVIDYPEIEQVLRFAPEGRRTALRRSLLRGIDRGVGRIVDGVRRLRWTDRTVFAVTSDLSLSSVAARVHRQQLDDAVLSAGGEPLYFTSDMAGFIGLHDPLQISPALAALEPLTDGKIDILLRKRQSGSRFQYVAAWKRRTIAPRYVRAVASILSTMARSTAPDIVLVYRDHVGTASVRAGRFDEAAGTLGMQWSGMHVPLILSGRGVVKGRVSTMPARLVDVAPTLAALMHLSRGKTDGTELADAMYLPAKSLIDREAMVLRQSRALVQALQHPTRPSR